MPASNNTLVHNTLTVDQKTDALIVVDVQNDFCPGGALPVPDGDAVVKLINAIMPKFRYVVLTQDNHPKDHGSFAHWPAHCVAKTQGADFHPDLDISRATHIVRKAYRRNEEAYSGFQKSGLAGTLRALDVKRVFVCGLATDYCVKATALDAKRRGFTVTVILAACRGVAPTTTAEAIKEMKDILMFLGDPATITTAKKE